MAAVIRVEVFWGVTLCSVVVRILTF